MDIVSRTNRNTTHANLYHEVCWQSLITQINLTQNKNAQTMSIFSGLFRTRGGDTSLGEEEQSEITTASFDGTNESEDDVEGEFLRLIHNFRHSVPLA